MHKWLQRWKKERKEKKDGSGIVTGVNHAVASSLDVCKKEKKERKERWLQRDVCKKESKV